ncbi:unnamed protein product [Oppiella nova]|uniref:Uncharacterized protein n=1 Tax=Oppiella nova TaxID=334625 RepID=A0A7R9M5K8_9ACAR|nr:unnamed protein product [Oppiella nova]CAG2171176.1 unnamed protein product [Oppiella nova]
MISNFATKTFPNHQSIATGFYEENHGIINNEFFDPKYNDTFDIDNSPDYWWTEWLGTPVWIVNQLYGRRSGSMQWPSSQVVYMNQTVRYHQSYNPAMPWDTRVDTIIEWITHKSEPANCIFLYFNEPDTTSHIYGPFSNQTKGQVRRADNIVGYLLQSLDTKNLLKKTNLIILSDHGFAEIKENQEINLNDIIDPNMYDMYGNSPDWHILPKPGLLDNVYEILLNASKTLPFTVYKKADIPERYHYSKNRRILPIFLIADEGWQVHRTASPVPLKGNHGWDNRLPSMRPLFMASGPAFKRRYYHNRVFLNTDLFPLMLRILGLPLKPFPSDGSLDSVIDLLGNNESNHSIRQLSASLSRVMVLSIIPISSPPILIVISFDGFRYDYVSPESTPTLYKLRTNGVSGK